jgi:hypothetical protein
VCSRKAFSNHRPTTLPIPHGSPHPKGGTMNYAVNAGPPYKLADIVFGVAQVNVDGEAILRFRFCVNRGRTKSVHKKF